MAMTDEESAALMNDIPFRNRIKVSALKYADALLNRPTDTPGINQQRAWGKNTQTMPDTVAMQLQPVVVMDTAVQEAGASITDAALQVVVETAVNKSF
jgi:hypothetical protein